MMETYTGLLVDQLRLQTADVRIEDIAHALSNICRFTGHVKRFYSVSEHSILVGKMCEKMAGCEAGLEGLLHDAAEAYLGDVNTHLKAAISAYNGTELVSFKDVEQWAMVVIRRALGVTNKYADLVKWADERALHYEAFWLLEQRPWMKHVPRGEGAPLCAPPEASEQAFLFYYKELTCGR